MFTALALAVDRAWRSIENKESIIHELNFDGIVIGGHCVFFLSTTRSEILAWFNMNDEVFTYVDLPCKGFASYVVSTYIRVMEKGKIGRQSLV